MAPTYKQYIQLQTDDTSDSAREIRAFRQLDDFFEQTFTPDHLRQFRAESRQQGFEVPMRSMPTIQHKSQDLVQFAAPVFFADSREGILHTDIMRIGQRHGRCQVRFHTVEVTARAGEAYKSFDMSIVFEEGEDMKTIDIPILNPKVWRTTCEFKIKLDEPQNCVLGSYLHTCRVKVMGLDAFPSNEIDLSGLKQGKAKFCWNLFFHTVSLVARSPGLAWRIHVSVVLSQLHNLHIFLTIFMSKYLVDVVLSKNVDEATTQQLLLHSGPEDGRVHTAWVIGAVFLLPMFLLHAVDLTKAKLNSHGRIKEFLQTNLFNQYLNYSEESRRLLGPSRLQVALDTGVDTIALSIVHCLDVADLLGKFIVLSSFVYFQNSQALFSSALMPVFMVIFVYCRTGILRQALKGLNDARVHVLKITQETCNKYSLIADYQQRPLMFDIFTEAASDVEERTSDANCITVNSTYFGKILGPLFICVHIVLHTESVISGEMSLGAYLATITVFKEFSGLYHQAYETFLSMSSSFSSLVNVTECFNMPLDVEERKILNRTRRQRLKEEREKLSADGFRSRADRVRIEIHDLHWSYDDNSEMPPVFAGINLSVEQGSIVAIKGDHGVGKTTLMRLLGNSLLPKQGDIFIPSHLRSLFVPEELVLLSASAWVNLTFGFEAAHPNRVFKILQGLEMESTMEILKKELEDNGKLHELYQDIDDLGEYFIPGKHGVTRSHGQDFGKGHVHLWSESLSASEASKISVVRALVVNPEVLIMHRPTSSFHDDVSVKSMDCLLDHVRNRGLYLPSAGVKNRRPRTLFYSSSTEIEFSYADVIWELYKDTKPGPSHARMVDQQSVKSHLEIITDSMQLSSFTNS